MPRNGILRKIFQSTLPSQGATQTAIPVSLHHVISIHAPLTGSDPNNSIVASCPHISIHAPLTGSDRSCTFIHCFNSNFNPRSPHRERPHPSNSTAASSIFQSTLPSQGATFSGTEHHTVRSISIHAPLTGSDYDKQAEQCVSYISIHAPLTGSDGKVEF